MSRNMNKFKKPKQQLGVFVTAGYPRLDSTIEQILLLQDKGVHFIEIGMPFSDPMADGPVIQQSSMVALQNGMNMTILFEQLRSVKAKVQVPLVLMGYINPVLKYGIEKFFSSAQECGISGLIIPDLSPEIYQLKYADQLNKFNIPLIHLVTPDTPDDRIKEIAQLSKKGFVYLVSSNSTTGTNQNLENRKERYSAVKDLCQPIPVYIGFGLKSRADLDLLSPEICDGHIIGSEYLRQLEIGKEHEFLNGITA